MAGILQHLRSSALDKRPNPASMVDGQIAINYASGAPGMFFKNSNGDLVKIGPVHVGSGAPNASPASGGTAGNSIGEQWLDNSGGTYVFKIWDGAAWRSEAGEFVNTTGDTMTGALILPSGTVGAPALGIGSTDNGIYSPGADQVAISTNGTGRLFVDASGNVGVGYASPNDFAGGDLGTTAPFVVGDGTGSRAIHLYSANSTYGHVAFSDGTSGTSEYAGLIQYYHTDDSMALYTAATESLRITSGGLVGVGTSSPTAALHVNSTGAVESLLSGGGTSGDTVLHLKGNGNAYKFIVPNTATQYGMSLYDVNNAAYRLFVSAAGNVGVGTTSPSSVLHCSATDAVLTLQGTRGTGATATVGTGGTNSQNLLITAGTDLYFRGATQLFQNVAGTTEYGRFDSSGRLLVGTSSARGVGSSAPSRVQLEVGNELGLSIVRNTNDISGAYLSLGHSRSSDAGGVAIVNSGDILGSIRFAGADGVNLESYCAEINAVVDGTPGANDMPGRLVFSTTADGASSPTERMRITSGGYALVGRGGGIGDDPSLGQVQAYRSGTADKYALAVHHDGNNSANYGIYVSCGQDAGNGWPMRIHDGDGTLVGSITFAGSSTSFNTSSDYRLKENVVNISDGITRVKQLRPKRFNFIADADTTFDGFLAHEAQAVVPEAVTGTHDEVDADGNPVYQGIDQSKLVPLLTAALQEALQKIETLEQRLSDAGIA